MDTQENTVKIAILETKIEGVREQQKAHNESTQKRFDELNTKLDELTAIMNRGKGAFAASMAMAGAVGAVLMAGISWVLSLIHR